MDHEVPGLSSALLALLDRIEIEDDASLARQRFEIAENLGLTVVFAGPASGATH